MAAFWPHQHKPCGCCFFVFVCVCVCVSVHVLLGLHVGNAHLLNTIRTVWISVQITHSKLPFTNISIRLRLALEIYINIKTHWLGASTWVCQPQHPSMFGTRVCSITCFVLIDLYYMCIIEQWLHLDQRRGSIF